MVTFTLSLAVFPPPALLSLTKKEKFKSLGTEGKTSHVEEILPLIIVDKSGIYLSGEDLDRNDLNIGPSVFVGRGDMVATSASTCSQL